MYDLFKILIFIITIVSIVIFGIIGSKDVTENKIHRDLSRILCVLIPVIMFILMFVIKFEKPMQECTGYITIVALNDRQTYIHSTHSIDLEDRYYYMAESPKGDGYVSGYIPQSNSIIIEDNSNPRIEIWNIEYKTWLGKVFTRSLGNIQENENESYKIFVPKGSIEQKFDIDLE